MSTSRRDIRGSIGWIAAAIVVIVILLAAVAISGLRMFYIFAPVSASEVGIRFSSGQIKDIVPPGLYSDFGLQVEIKRVSSSAVHFVASDAEVLTSDRQRIGVDVSGDVFRPVYSQRELLINKWAQYSTQYLFDDALKATIDGLAKQAMKSCVGERTFDNNVIGTARDELRNCIDDNLNVLVEPYGLSVNNIVVPNVTISPEAQTALDAITTSRLAETKAKQDELTAKAQADAAAALAKGEVLAAQARVQEEARQAAVTAALLEAQYRAEASSIQARKDNELLEANLSLKINEALASAAKAKAEADLANTLVQAGIFTSNPQYTAWSIAQLNASALKATDKIIFTPEGTTPTIVLPGEGIQPVIDTTP